MDQALIVMKEAFLARLVPVMHEVELTALQKFHPEQYPLHALLAAVAALAASAVLFLLGRWLRRWPERVSTEAQQARIEALRGVAREWLPWLLILSAAPFGGILIIAAGFFALPPLLAGLAIAAAQVLWRMSPML